MTISNSTKTTFRGHSGLAFLCGKTYQKLFQPLLVFNVSWSTVRLCFHTNVSMQFSCDHYFLVVTVLLFGGRVTSLSSLSSRNQWLSIARSLDI